MKKRTLRLGRLTAVITLPFVMSACTSWQQQDVASLRDVIIRDQPERVRLRTRSEGEFDLENPQVAGDTISGYGPTGVVGIHLADVAEASVQKVDAVGPMVVGVLGVGFLMSIVLSLEVP